MMLRQIEILVRLELSNCFSWNVLRHTKDPKVKRKAYLMAVAYVFLALVAGGYLGGMSYGLVMLGVPETVPAYLIVVSSLFIFLFGTFTAGASLFRRNGYEMLCALPLSRWAVVASRFVRMYVENLVLTAVVMVPGLIVYALSMHPGGAVYLAWGLGLVMVPLLPVAAAALAGTVVVGISSRMKHKSLVEAGLSVLLVLSVMLMTPEMAKLEGQITPELLTALSARLMQLLGTVYPPAVWLGSAMTSGNILLCLGCAAGFALGFCLVASAIALRYDAICRRLFSSQAKHDYRMEKQKGMPLLVALCAREFRRYFASGVYVSNTIIGPVMGTLLSGALFFTGVDGLQKMLMLPVDISPVVPIAVAGSFCMMTPASVSVSMEGKELWILKSLPVPVKAILDAKLLMNLLLMLPFYLVSEVFLILALQPVGLELVWLVMVPVVLAVFSCVFGIAVNLRMPLLEWENEVSVVKQSGSALLGGLGGMLVAILWGAAVMLAPGGNSAPVMLAGSLLLTAAAVVLYGKNNRVDLKTL